MGRADLPVLPAVGLSWTPRRTTRLDLRFPESRLSQRLFRDGDQSETWSYVSLGLGGNTWAVTRNSGLHDELSLRDIRLIVGVDHLIQGGGGWFAEFGYAFARRIEYEATDSEVPLSDGVLLQAGWRYYSFRSADRPFSRSAVQPFGPSAVRPVSRSAPFGSVGMRSACGRTKMPGLVSAAG